MAKQQPQGADAFAVDQTKSETGPEASQAFTQPEEIKPAEFNYRHFHKDAPVIRVKHPDNPKRFFIINATDFDADVHQPFSEEDEKRAAKAIEAKEMADDKVRHLEALKTIVRG